MIVAVYPGYKLLGVFCFLGVVFLSVILSGEFIEPIIPHVVLFFLLLDLLMGFSVASVFPVVWTKTKKHKTKQNMIGRVCLLRFAVCVVRLSYSTHLKNDFVKQSFGLSLDS